MVSSILWILDTSFTVSQLSLEVGDHVSICFVATVSIFVSNPACSEFFLGRGSPHVVQYTEQRFLRQIMVSGFKVFARIVRAVPSGCQSALGFLVGLFWLLISWMT